MGEFIEIQPDVNKSYLPLDIAALHYADLGACGSSGVIRIITSDKRMFRINYAYDGWKKEDIYQMCPLLTDMRNLPEGWASRYMGLGNWLFVRDDILAKMPIDGIGLGELYKNWTNFVMDAL